MAKRSSSPARFVGLDVHKHSVMACMVDGDQQLLRPPRRMGLDGFERWASTALQKTDAVVLEASTNAWEFYDFLVPLVASVTVANPRLVKLIAKARVKTDGRDDYKAYEAAARAYRQLAIALRGQGLTEAADRFTYRAFIMQRKALWWQMRSIPLLAGPAKQVAEAEQAPQQLLSARLRLAAQQIRDRLTGILRLGRLLGSYLFSWFLAVLTGYGFRMSRIVVAYLLLICGFATAYWSVGVHQPRDISFWTALIVSVTAFHGRVFTNPFTPANIPDAQVIITAIEAIVGLVIEGVFIAMLTQRFFTR